MSLSEEKLARLRKEFPCYHCNGTGYAGGGVCRCLSHDRNRKGIDWQDAYEALGKELERERAARYELAMEIIEDFINETMERRRKNE